MVECPDCHSNNVTSKGYREGSKAKRYICKHCGRNFTVPIALPSKIQEEVDSVNTKAEITMTTIAVSKEIKNWLESLKLVKQEPLNSVIERIKNKGRE